MTIKIINEPKRNFKTIIKWRYVIRLIFDILSIILIISLAISFAVLFNWEFNFIINERLKGVFTISYIVLSIAGLFTNVSDIIDIISSGMLFAEKYIGDDPKLAFLTKKKE